MKKREKKNSKSPLFEEMKRLFIELEAEDGQHGQATRPCSGPCSLGIFFFVASGRFFWINTIPYMAVEGGSVEINFNSSFLINFLSSTLPSTWPCRALCRLAKVPNFLHDLILPHFCFYSSHIFLFAFFNS